MLIPRHLLECFIHHLIFCSFLAISWSSSFIILFFTHSSPSLGVLLSSSYFVLIPRHLLECFFHHLIFCSFLAISWSASFIINSKLEIIVEYYSYLVKDIKIGNPGKIKILVAVKKMGIRQTAERPFENLISQHNK